MKGSAALLPLMLVFGPAFANTLDDDVIEARLVGCGSEIAWHTTGAAQFEAYVVEYWSRDNHKWRQTGAVSRNRAGRLLQGVDEAGNRIIREGRLHRVTACSDGSTACVHSKAMWAPWGACPGEFGSPQTLEEMEEYIEVVEEDGVSRYSPSREDPRQAIIEYNIGLAIREFWSFGDRTSAPAMLKPLKVHNPPRLHSLFFSVYWYYELLRQRGEEALDLSGTGEEVLADQLP